MMDLDKQFPRPSALAAARVPETHAPAVGRFAVWAPTVPGEPARRRPAVAYRTTSGSADGQVIGCPNAGGQIPAVNLRFTGDLRGVPPRGGPV